MRPLGATAAHASVAYLCVISGPSLILQTTPLLMGQHLVSAHKVMQHYAGGKMRLRQSMCILPAELCQCLMIQVWNTNVPVSCLRRQPAPQLWQKLWQWLRLEPRALLSWRRLWRMMRRPLKDLQDVHIP